MRILPDGMLAALTGTAADVSVLFNIWYDGTLAVSNIPCRDWSISWDATRQVMGQGKFTFLDPDGYLIPWAYDDALSVGGGKVQVKFLVNGASIDLGFLRITRSEPQEKWKLYSPGGIKTWVAGGHLISVSADDLTTEVASNRFLAPESAPALATVFSEFRRVCAPFMDVILTPGLLDRSVPATVVYQQDRLATLQQLADSIGAGLRVAGGGQLNVYPTGGASVWTVKGGSYDANLITAKRTANYAGLYNGVVSRNTLADGTPIQAYAFQHGGPLDWNGPHGHVLYEHNANFSTSVESLQKDAATTLANLARRRASTIPFQGLLHPGIETGDTVTMLLPVFDGTEASLSGTISQVAISGSGGVNAQMDYSVDVLDDDLAAISAAVRTKKWLWTR